MKKWILMAAFVFGVNAVYGQAASAIAKLNPTKDSKVTGRVAFSNVEGGVMILAEVKGLTPGKHGFHIHEKGDCSAPDAASAGGHYNPHKKPHGAPDNAERHVGDMGNLVADENGIAVYARIDDVIKLDGPDSIIGKSIIVHSDEDDFVTQPHGNAGSRVACGVIEELK